MRLAAARRRPLVALSAFAVAALLTGCAGPTPSPPRSPSAAAEPVTVDNCGFELAVAAPPERIVTIKSTSTEMLLALGLGDRIIGTAFPDGPVPDEWADDAADIPVISDQVPSEEALLDLEPDFVYAGWESNVTDEGAGDRGALAELGVGTYVSPAACKEAGYQPEKLSFDDVFAEITEAGSVFGAPDAAAALVAAQSAKLDEVTPSTAGLSALWYSSGSDAPYVGAGIGAPQMMMDAVGLDNIAADVDDTWTALSWEAVVDANPEVIVLVDATWNTAAAKIEALESNPATAELAAVQNGSYLTIPFAASEAGVRNVDAVVDLSAQLTALDPS